VLTALAIVANVRPTGLQDSVLKLAIVVLGLFKIGLVLFSMGKRVVPKMDH